VCRKIDDIRLNAVSSSSSSSSSGGGGDGKICGRLRVIDFISD